MYKRVLGLSALEWVLLLMGAAGSGYLWYLFGSSWWKYVCTLTAFGFLFEASMAPLFTYCPQMRDRHCVQGSDVNFLLALGWMEIAAAILLVSYLAFHKPSLPGCLLGGLLVGNIHEFLFFHCGGWRYNYQAAYIGKFKPLWPKIPVTGIPVQVILGYANVGLAVYVIAYMIL